MCVQAGCLRDRLMDLGVWKEPGRQVWRGGRCQVGRYGGLEGAGLAGSGGWKGSGWQVRGSGRCRLGRLIWPRGANLAAWRCGGCQIDLLVDLLVHLLVDLLAG